MKILRCLRWVGTMFVVAVIACATTVPPRDLIERNDHRGLATWYEQEAVRLRSKADEMRRMAEEYASPSFQPAPKETRAELITHCELFVTYYTRADDEADALAKLHRQEDKALP